jgi:GT2 family glycosyltransferase
MKTPVVVGLTLNFRDFQRSCDCVATLLSDGATHVVVWDNSEDAGECSSRLAAFWNKDNRVSVLVSPVNIGFAAAVNRGIQWIKARFDCCFVALINNDALFVPGALLELTGALLSNTGAIIAYPKIDHGGKVMGTVFYQRLFGLFLAYQAPDSAPFASGCAMLLRVDNISGPLFDETFFMYGEDVELGWRLHQRRGALLHLPKMLVHHVGSASSGMGSLFYESRMVAAHFILARKLARNLVHRWIMIFGRVLTLSIRALLRTLRYKSFVPLNAFIEGWYISNGIDPLFERAKIALSDLRIEELS